MKQRKLNLLTDAFLCLIQTTSVQDSAHHHAASD